MAEQRVQASPAEIAQRLSTVIGDEFVRVDSSLDELLCGRSDALVVVEPASEEEVASIFEIADGEGWSVCPAGACTQLGFGNVSKPIQVVVCSTRMNQILDHSPSDLVVTVQPGATLSQLQQTLARHGQMLPIDPVCPPQATIGGILATAVTGPLRMLYGTLRDLTIGLHMVYPHGEVVKTGAKVVKNVAGYDMTKLFVGSLGTLAFISEITFKLRPLPLYTELCLIAGDANALARVTAQVINSNLIPSRMEALHGPYAGWNEAKDWVLAVESHENEQAAAYQSAALARLAQQEGLTYRVLRKDDVESFWQGYRASVLTTAFSIKVSAPPNQSIALMNEARRWLPDSAQNAYFSVTPVSGVARLFAEGLSLEDEVRLLSQLRAKVARFQGSVVIENGSVVLRQRVDAFGATRSDFLLQQRIKDAIDPHNRMNPGRFLGGI